MNMVNSGLTASTLLNPDYVRVDGRDSRDQLAFAANFSRLILYYNQNNQQDGNWQTFFLKDPVILLAAISKTDYGVYHRDFIRIEQSAHNTNGLATGSSPANSLPTDWPDQLIDQLCDLLQSMFTTMNQWLRIMNRFAHKGTLHEFLKRKIEDPLSAELWLLVAIQQKLSAETGGKVKPPPLALYLQFEPGWQSKKGYLQHLLNESNIKPSQPRCNHLLDALQRTWRIVMDVMVQLIDSAKKAFYQLENQSTEFPDTALLMAFCRLMQNQQSEINRLGGKHLDFYYEKVLLQTRLPAQPDSVIVCLTLTEAAQPLTLAAGTAFKAGSYPDQSDILFANAAAAEINRAAIARASSVWLDAQQEALYLNPIATPNQVVRNEMQEIVSWNALGSTATVSGTGAVSVQQGFALASPMLFLQGGARTISVEFGLGSAPTLADHLAGARFYLSTEKAWLDVSQFSQFSEPGGNTLKIILAVDVAPIVAFAANPDGYVSAWPVLKIMPDKPINLAPVLNSVTISVDVEQFPAVSMANDLSILPGTGASLIFGPIPEVGSHFYIGSNECFAKPLKKLMVCMNWDNVPTDFAQYYASYNQFLATNTDSAATTVSDPDSSDEPPTDSSTFNNQAFTGKWQVLSGRTWSTMPATSVLPDCLPDTQSTAATPDTTQGTTQDTTTSCTCQSIIWNPATPVSLFQQCKPGDNTLACKLCKNNLPTSVFAFNFGADNGWQAVPALATTALPAFGLAQDGYLRFELTTPDQAFGHSLYAKVVSWISLRNAEYLINLTKPTPPDTEKTAGKGGASNTPGLANNTAASAPASADGAAAGAAAAGAAAAGAAAAGAAAAGAATTAAAALVSDARLGPVLKLLSLIPGVGGVLVRILNIISGAQRLASIGKGIVSIVTGAFAKLKSGIASGAALVKQLIQGGVGKLKSGLQAVVASIAGLFGKKSTKDDPSKDDPNKVDPPPKPALLDLPNLPYSPKQASLSICYSAQSSNLISSTPTSQPNPPYPLELYHYGVFNTWLAYDALALYQNQGNPDNLLQNGIGFANLTPTAANAQSAQSAQLSLLPGVGAPACLYVTLRGVVAPCTLSLYAQVTTDEDFSTSARQAIAFYYWGQSGPQQFGWQALTCLQDDTQNLSCSGIIKLALPQLPGVLQTQGAVSYLINPLMPGQDFCLAISSVAAGKTVRLSYLNTQAVKLTRQDVTLLAPGEVPQIAAGAISAPPLPAFATVVQPFASSGGLPAESKDAYDGYDSFYRRVSQRIQNKDRASNSHDYVVMAQDACIDLFYAKTLDSTGPLKSDTAKSNRPVQPGVLHVGLVKAYADAQQPNAFRPLLDGNEQAAIQKQINSRISAMATVNVMNLQHQPVLIQATLVITDQANQLSLIARIVQDLNLYLSPWILTDVAQMVIDQGINRSDLISFLCRSAEVLAVSDLEILLTPAGGGTAKPDMADPVLPAPDAILVSGMNHVITVRRANADANETLATMVSHG